MNCVYVAILAGLVLASEARAQADTTLVQDALYDRPFIGELGSTSIGGYLEGNTNYFVVDGVSEGFSMELRRFNVFLFSTLGPRVRFISELEFEHGTEEIALETALIDVQLDRAFVLRGGILLPPVGAFNQNHDSPLWEFVERPLVSTEVIPSTLSEVGFGVFGKVFRGRLGWTYDLYLTNGLGDGIVLNDQGRTHLPSGKHNELFEEDNNGSPALSARTAVHLRPFGEAGLSYYGGIYNAYRIEGEAIDEKRRVSIWAFDFNATLAGIGVRGEAALARVEVQDALKELFGESQWGGHLDVVLPVWRPQFFGYDTAVLNINLRLERIDYNAGTFEATGQKIYDEQLAVVPGISFRTGPGTVFRANYRYHRYRDLLGNPAVRSGGLQFGFAAYF
jgi:hypothetical protein